MDTLPSGFRNKICCLADIEIKYLLGPKRLTKFESENDRYRLRKELGEPNQAFIVEYWEELDDGNDKQCWSCCAVVPNILKVSCAAAICEGCVPSRFSGTMHDYFRVVSELIESLAGKENILLTNAADSYLMLEGQPTEADIESTLAFNERHLGISYREISKRHFKKMFQQGGMLVIGQTFG